MNRSDLPEIKQGLRDRIIDLCGQLLPDGKRSGRLWVAHNPVTQDYSQSAEFKVALDRDIGAWKDYRTGEKGDVIKLVQYVMATDVKGALAWSRDFLGFSRMNADDRRRMAEKAKAARQVAEQKERADTLKRMEHAERIWSSGFQDGAASSAEAFARRYFAARGIPLEEIANRDLQTLRFTHEQEFWKRAVYRYEDGKRIKVKAGPKYPAILSAMRLATGQISAVHMTFLDPLGPRKLPVDKGEDENSKIMFGPSAGAVIRITHGPEGQPPEMARQAFPLLLGEGLETTATNAMVMPEMRAWAAGSLSNMLTAPVWLPCVSSIVLLRDHFKHPTTEKQFDDVCAVMARSGKPWVAIESIAGNDFNDMVNEGDA